MDRQKFIEKFVTASDSLDQAYINETVSKCLDRCHDLYPEYERGHMNIMSTTEELAELTEAISQRVRKRVTDNYDILQEIGDVYLSILCIAEIFNISHEDIRKAINVKTDREAGRIKEHFKHDAVQNNPKVEENKLAFILHLPSQDVHVTNEDVDNIMETAMNGCSYWCASATPVGNYLGEYASEQISKDGTLDFNLLCQDGTAKLTKEKFERGLYKWVTECLTKDNHVIVGHRIDLGEIDADAADVILQYALFNKVIYS